MQPARSAHATSISCKLCCFFAAAHPDCFFRQQNCQADSPQKTLLQMLRQHLEQTTIAGSGRHNMPAPPHHTSWPQIEQRFVVKALFGGAWASVVHHRAPIYTKIISNPLVSNEGLRGETSRTRGYDGYMHINEKKSAVSVSVAKKEGSSLEAEQDKSHMDIGDMNAFLKAGGRRGMPHSEGEMGLRKGAYAAFSKTKFA